MWFCIRCGREVSSRNELIKGYCIDCYKQVVKVFKKQPDIQVTICPKCRSWVFKGEWMPPLPLVDIVENTLRHELNKYLGDELELRDVYVKDMNEVGSNTLESHVDLSLNIQDHTIPYTTSLLVKVKHRVCDKCLAKSTGKYSYLIQVRFTSRNIPEKLQRDVESIVASHILNEPYVEIREAGEGVDIELSDEVVTRKLLEAFSKKYSVYITSTFKSTRFDPQRGRWLGVVTYSIRIPVFRINDIVIYKNKIGIVKDVEDKKLTIYFPDTNEVEIVDSKYYWLGLLKIPIRVEREVLIAREILNDKITVEDPDTGTLKTFKLKYKPVSLKPGDKISLIRTDNLEVLTVFEQGD